MKTLIQKTVRLTYSVDRQVVQILLVILTLALFVIGAGAPGIGGGSTDSTTLLLFSVP